MNCRCCKKKKKFPVNICGTTVFILRSQIQIRIWRKATVGRGTTIKREKLTDSIRSHTQRHFYFKYLYRFDLDFGPNRYFSLLWLLLLSVVLLLIQKPKMPIIVQMVFGRSMTCDCCCEVSPGRLSMWLWLMAYATGYAPQQFNKMVDKRQLKQKICSTFFSFSIFFLIVVRFIQLSGIVVN